jgi:glutamyl endopeptidase
VIELMSVSKPAPSRSPFESLEAAPTATATKGSWGTATDEVSKSLRHLVRKGWQDSAPRIAPILNDEAVISPDDRVRILDTDLAPWRMICALRMRGPSGVGLIGTGWFIGPKTVLTAGHCVFSTKPSGKSLGGWASTIELIPGLNGDGDGLDARPYGSVASQRFSSVHRWVNGEDADFDIGCIHLDEPLGLQVGWFAVAALPSERLEGFVVNVSGYPYDRGFGAEQYYGRDLVVGVSERRLFYEVDTYGGQSGAPVWIYEDDDAPPLAVGIHAYGPAAGLEVPANSAPRIIPEVLGLLTGWVKQDGGWPQG